MSTITGITLSPTDIIGNQTSNISLTFDNPLSLDVDLTPFISIDPSYIATVGSLTSNDGGITWTGLVTRTPYMNRLGNTLTFDSTGSSFGVSTDNVTFDVAEISSLIQKEWTQNDTLKGESNKNDFGKIVSMSPDGNYMVISNKQSNGEGKVILYSYSSQSDSWVYKYERRDESNYAVDQALSLSKNANYLASGSPSTNKVIIFKGLNLTLQGNYYQGTIQGPTTGEWFGHSVSFSSGGNILAVGAPKNGDKGAVYIYSGSNSNWNKIGTIYGDTTSEHFGHTVSLSGDGTSVAVGSPYYNSSSTVTSSGRVQVYFVSGGLWNNKRGATIFGENKEDECGLNISLSYDGMIVAIGENRHTSTQDRKGRVRIFKFVGNSWTPIGNIIGEHNISEFGWSVSLSSDGTRVAIGAPEFVDNYDTLLWYERKKKGSAYIYDYDGVSTWSNEKEILSDNEGSKLGYSVSLSGDGNRVAIGAFKYDTYGEVWLYDRSINITRNLTDITLTPADIISPNTSSNFEIKFTTNDKTFEEINGFVTLNPDDDNICSLSNLATSNHGFSLIGDINAELNINQSGIILDYYETDDISGNKTFNINTSLALLGCTLTPENLVDVDASATLRIEFNTPLPADISLNNYIDLDPSYIATLGTMSDVSSGLVWEGTLTRTPNMNKLENKLDFDFSYNGVEVSANLVYDVVQDNDLFGFSNKVGRYIKLIQNASTYLHISQLRVFDAVGTNIAYGKVVTSSTLSRFSQPYGDDQASYTVVTNGVINNPYGNFLSTDGGGGWIQLDLGFNTEISSIEVYNADTLNRINGTEIQLISDDNTVKQSWIYNIEPDTQFSNTFVVDTNVNLIHKATNISTISNINYPDTSTNFVIQLTTNDVSLSVIVDPSNVANITNTTLTNYGFTLEGQLDASGEHNVSGVKLFYEDFSSNAFDIYSIQDLSINEFVFNDSAVTYENYQNNTIALTLNRNDLTNVDISNSLTVMPSSCGQIVDVSGTGVTRIISFEPTFYINESDCSLTFNYNISPLDASMTIPFSVDTSQQIEDISMNPRSILEPNSVSTLGVKFRLPVESSGTPDITISPSYIANINSISAISGDTWTGTIERSQNKNLLYNTIDFSYNGFDTSLNFNVAQNPELIVGPREIGDFIEGRKLKIIGASLTEALTIKEVEITNDIGSLLLKANCSFVKSDGTGGGDFIMDGINTNSSTINSTTEPIEKSFTIIFTSQNVKIKNILIYASNSVNLQLLDYNDNIITNLGQLEVVDIDTSATINIANASTQSTITRAVTDITLDPSNIVYPEKSSIFEMLFSTNDVSLSDISNTYLSFDPSNAAHLTNLSLTDNDFKLVGNIEANEKIFEEVCKLKYDETIDISGEKQLAIKDLFISSSSIVPKTNGVSSINFEHNVGNLELVFTLDKPDLVLSDFVLDNSASITNLTKDGLKWNADITFPRTDSDISVNYNIDVNYKSGDSYPISKTYNTYVPIVGDTIPVLDIYQEVPEPDGDNLDLSLNDTTILTSGSPTDQRKKREVFIERLLEKYKNKLKNTTDKLFMKTEALLGTNSGITKEKIKIIDNFDTNGDKLSDISFDTQSLSGDEALYVPLDVGYSIILDTYSSKLKVEKVSDTSFNVYENYTGSGSSITKVMTYDETSIYDFFQYKIGTVEGENLPAITDISLNPSNIISDLSSNLQVTFSQPAIEPIISIDPSYIADLSGSMTMVDSSGYIWSGTINRTLEMNRLDNILTVSGEHHSLDISFNVVEDYSYINGSNELIRILKHISTPSDIIYPDSSSNFEVLFTTNDKSLDDISGNLQLDPSGVGNLTNLQLAHSGFKLVGNIEAPSLKKNKDTKLKYFETVDISGESDLFTVYTYPPFQLVNFALTPENIVGPNDVSSNLQIEFNIPISSDTSLNNSITIDPSYIVNLDAMTTNDNGYTWSGVMDRSQYMNKLGNKLELNYTDNSLSDLNDNAFTASAELLFDVLESKNVLKWEKKIDTSLNETFNETVEISPNGQILAQISGSDAKIFHLQSDSTWSLEEEISGNHLALCDNRIAIATDVSLQVYEYDSSWSQIGSSISASNVSNLDISIDGNRVAYIYDVSSVGIQEYISSSWTPMTIVGTITGNSVKFSPNGSLLGVGTLDSENQNFSNVNLYEYDSSSWNLKT